MEFSEKIKNARLAAGISQRELAEKTGLSKRTIQNYEMGARIPKSRDTYEILAKALGIKEEVLLDDNAEFILQANAIYGPRGAKQAWDMVHELKAVFAGGELADEDLDSIMRLSRMLTGTQRKRTGSISLRNIGKTRRMYEEWKNLLHGVFQINMGQRILFE